MSYLVHSDNDREELLKEIGIDCAYELFKSIPESIRYPKIKLPLPLSEKEIRDKLTNIGSKNNSVSGFSSFLGGGAYNHYVPSIVKSILGRSEFYTAYTPYQAEISQGTLQYIFEFQSLICRLTGMDISNASMYDGASALAEAILMANRINGKSKVIMSKTIHPEYRDTCKTYCLGKNINIIEIGYTNGRLNLDILIKKIDNDVSSIVIQNPNFFGCFEEVYKIKEIISKYPNCLFIVAINPISVAIIKSPSDYGADIVVGEGQVLGNQLCYGGPYLGFFATKSKYLRQIPGRIVSRTVDTKGNDAYVLAFQAREQHIRKYKATSNICSNHSLNALAATVYLSILGEEGLKELANICMQRAHYFSSKVKLLSKFNLRFDAQFFNEFVVSTDVDAGRLLEKLYKENILGGIYLGKYYPDLKNCILVSITEMNSIKEIDNYIGVLKEF